MIKRYYPWMIVLVPFAVLILGLTLLRPSHANAQPPQQYPIMDKVANKIILKIRAVKLPAVAAEGKPKSAASVRK